MPVFLEGYLEEYAQAMADKGNDDYVVPDAAQYTACTPFESRNTYYYFQIGCADGTSQELAVNIYSDNTCTTRSEVDGIDDANIDVSELQVRDGCTRQSAISVVIVGLKTNPSSFSRTIDSLQKVPSLCQLGQ